MERFLPFGHSPCPRWAFVCFLTPLASFLGAKCQVWPVLPLHVPSSLLRPTHRPPFGVLSIQESVGPALGSASSPVHLGFCGWGGEGGVEWGQVGIQLRGSVPDIWRSVSCLPGKASATWCGSCPPFLVKAPQNKDRSVDDLQTKVLFPPTDRWTFVHCHKRDQLRFRFGSQRF